MIRAVVPVSGGKDSQAALKLAVGQFGVENIVGLFCDTQNEHPITYAHIERLRTLYGALRIDTVCAGSVEEKCIKYGRFPGGGARFCTDELKIVPTKKYCKALAESLGHGFEVWYGMRSKESPERQRRYAGKVCDELYAPHEVLPSKYPKYLAALGVMFRLAVLDWTDADVMAFLEGQHNPLYDAGFPRVGCFPCGASGDRWKEKAFQHDDFGKQQYIRVQDIGRRIGKSIWTSKGGQARNQEFEGCNLCEI
ncbi:hypothetical protein D8I35_05505 [Corticibacter populi]|uniref:Phosphoadenosine phosphosulphate reductase domain-containing protein n=1 Tax=Corticibacter populi TaxID=1550736 RepID=A0A3M6R049_9BURK|nr:phosphoadenosine phosphosulfate reductase family protein [Corticibacter populi]RMX08533.1 hypothetical protein D8I35_05505 [Corticibacter populi]RZS35850.1 phosphoadenosine phosphosulfate reductase family protein [Corticibacter populi]